MSRAGWSAVFTLAALAGAGFWFFWHDSEEDIGALNLDVVRLHSLGKDAEAAAKCAVPGSPRRYPASFHRRIRYMKCCIVRPFACD